MSSLFLVALMVSIVAGQVPALREYWLEDRPGAIRSIKVLVYYFVYILAGFGVLVALADSAHDRAGGDGNAAMLPVAALMTFFLCWIFLGAAMLLRVVPRRRTVEPWIDRWARRLEPVAAVLLVGAGLVAVA
jgi:hypothetical protein